MQSVAARIWPGERGEPRTSQGSQDLLAPYTSGLQIVGAVEIVAAAVSWIAALAAGAPAGMPLRTAIAIFLTGCVTIAASRMPQVVRYTQAFAGFSAMLAGLLFLSAGGAHFLMSALLVLVVVAAVPYRPVHGLLLGVAFEAMYILYGFANARWEILSTSGGRLPDYTLPLILPVALTLIAATNYKTFRTNLKAQREAVRKAEILTAAQFRAELAENARAVGKLAAVITHEINTPLGALHSSIETLGALTDRQLNAPPPKREILATMRADLSRSIAESAARIEEAMGRIEALVNLDEAEQKTAAINDLLHDVALLFEERVESQGIRLEFHMAEELPLLNCRPQLLSTALASMLENACDAVGPDGVIIVSTKRRDEGVEITITDNGRGMSSDETEQIFDPAFKITGGRVLSSNWSLFHTRQVIYEHGGEIHIETAKGRGTAIHVTLPCV